MSSAAVHAFAYQAQTTDGQALNGTLEATDIEQASHQLQMLQLRVLAIEPAERPRVKTAFRRDDFLAFNQQLAHLTSGGLPIERSLRLMAADVRRGRQRRSVESIATELEKGVPLGQAFANNKSGFPPLYGRLLDAGVRAGNLPGLLLNLGRHVELLQRLRTALWRSATYPLAVLTALLGAMAFIWFFLMPQILPLMVLNSSVRFLRWTRGSVPRELQSTALMFSIAQIVSLVMMACIALLLLAVALLWILGRTTAGARLVERLTIPVPLIGPILRFNLLARWCDGLHLGVQAGLDLPAAIALASDAVDSSALRDDGQKLSATIAAGLPMDLAIDLRLLPTFVPAALQMGAEQNDLPATVAMLARMYQQQAESRMTTLPQVLSPLLLLITAVCIGLTMAAVLMPLSRVLQMLMAV